MTTAIVYIHGFNSSPASFKARVLCEQLVARGIPHRYLAPALPPSPRAAADILEGVAREYPEAVLVGSSLGGFYATWLAENFNLRAVLLNPAVRPYDLLAGYVGRQKNLYSGEEYDFTREHIEEMRALEIETINPQRYYLMVTTGDEVLDYRAAIRKYAGAQQLVVEGGDHGFGTFGDYVDAVFRFVRAEAAQV